MQARDCVRPEEKTISPTIRLKQVAFLSGQELAKQLPPSELEFQRAAPFVGKEGLRLVGNGCQDLWLLASGQNRDSRSRLPVG